MPDPVLRETTLDEAEAEAEAEEAELEDAGTPVLVLLAPELVPELALLTITVIRELAPDTVVEVAELVVEPLRAADTAEDRLDSWAEFVMVLSGTKVELTMDTLVTTDCGTELTSDEVVELLGVTKLRLVPSGSRYETNREPPPGTCVG